MAEGGGLLNRYTVKSRIGGSNPPLSAIPTIGTYVVTVPPLYLRADVPAPAMAKIAPETLAGSSCENRSGDSNPFLSAIPIIGIHGWGVPGV